MKENKDESRNRPAREGKGNDPALRDDSGQQPGVSTLSSSSSDEENEKLSKTASDSFREDLPDERADLDFDDVDGGNS